MSVPEIARRTLSRCLFAALLVLVVTAPPAAAQMGPSSPDDLVTLVAGFYSSAPGCGVYPNAVCINTRANSDGTNTHNWTVPAGKKLVVTGIDWVIESPGALDGGNDTLFFHSINAAGTRGSKIFDESVEPGRQSKDVEISGVAVDSGFHFVAAKSGLWSYATIFVRGYLVDERPGRR